MRTGQGRVAVSAVLAAVMTTACLEDNPWFEEPTGSDSGGGTTMVGATTTVTPPPATTTSGSTTDEEDDDTETTDTTGSLTTTSTTGVMPVCGDGIPEGGEECDEGADNADDGTCTTTCKIPGCGDGLLQMGEACDDGNPDSDDGCVACQVPRTCAEIQGLDANAASGAYVLDLDGSDPALPVAVYCDMTTTGGGWTVIERSAEVDPIGVALFKDYPVNLDQPGEAPFRLGRAAMELMLLNTTEMRIDCGGSDYLLTSSLALFEGEQGGVTCENAAAIMYKEASLKGFMKTDVLLCTGFLGAEDGCEGAWYIDESAQYLCQMGPYPWDFMIPVTSQSADTFAVDPALKDTQPPVHDCHQDGAVRVVMLR